jgi:hypothetical protein
MKIIAACGLICSECDAYKATQAGDAKGIDEIAAEWREQFNPQIQSADVWCDGCMKDGRKCAHAKSGCAIRACAVTKKVANCAECDVYPCEEIAAFMISVPQAHKTLKELRGE